MRAKKEKSGERSPKEKSGERSPKKHRIYDGISSKMDESRKLLPMKGKKRAKHMSRVREEIIGEERWNNRGLTILQEQE